MLRGVTSLGVPWHEGKGDDHFTLSKGNVSDFRNVFAAPGMISVMALILLGVQKIHGSLRHVTFVYADSRSRLFSLSNFTPPSSTMMSSRFFAFLAILWSPISTGGTACCHFRASLDCFVHEVLYRILACMSMPQLRGVLG